MSSFFVCFTNWIFETNISSRTLQFINQTSLKHLACSYSLPPSLKKKKKFCGEFYYVISITLVLRNLG